MHKCRHEGSQVFGSTGLVVFHASVQRNIFFVVKFIQRGWGDPRMLKSFPFGIYRVRNKTSKRSFLSLYFFLHLGQWDRGVRMKNNSKEPQPSHSGNLFLSFADLHFGAPLFLSSEFFHFELRLCVRVHWLRRKSCSRLFAISAGCRLRGPSWAQWQLCPHSGPRPGAQR